MILQSQKQLMVLTFIWSGNPEVIAGPVTSTYFFNDFQIS